VVDQAALHGLLGKVRDLGLPWTTEGGDHRLNRQINSPTIHERGSVASKNESLDRIQ
jgi:hypothetical protein